MEDKNKIILSNTFKKFLSWKIKNISENNFILISAGIIGIVSGFAAVVLKSTVHAISYYLALGFEHFGNNYLYLIYPILGITITTLLAKYLFKEKLGHGITQILYSISKNSSIIERTKMYSRMITSSITVGFGGSVGLEAPIVVTGSAIGSNIASFFHLNYKNRSLLLGCGAAGAISAIFNSPVTGVIFVMEVIFSEVKINKFIPLLIASVSGQLISIILLGEDILFSFKLVDAFRARETGYYLLLGGVCGLTSLYFTRMMYFFEKVIKRVKHDISRAFIGGISLSFIILLFPSIYGEGYNTIKNLLAKDTQGFFSSGIFQISSDYEIVFVVILLLIILVKPIATAMTIGAGGSGGVFAPSLFMGGMTGYLFSTSSNMLFGTSLSHSNFTLVGMCGVMSGILHAPLTAIFLIAEITSGYMLFVPLMIVSAVSLTTMLYFEKYSIYTKRLMEAGDLLHYDKDQMVLSLINLKKILEKDLLCINPEETLEDLVKLVKKSKRNIFPVVNSKNELEGIITLDDVREKIFDEEDRSSIMIKAIMQQPPASVSTNENMQSVMNKFQTTQAWNLPVIDDEKYIGFISKSRIFNAYRNKLKMDT